jgi:hypothetical protein
MVNLDKGVKRAKRVSEVSRVSQDVQDHLDPLVNPSLVRLVRVVNEVIQAVQVKRDQRVTQVQSVVQVIWALGDKMASMVCRDPWDPLEQTEDLVVKAKSERQGRQETLVQSVYQVKVVQQEYLDYQVNLVPNVHLVPVLFVHRHILMLLVPMFPVVLLLLLVLPAPQHRFLQRRLLF